jgi:DNA polymerase III epsilon subunit family exonuclease
MKNMQKISYRAQEKIELIEKYTLALFSTAGTMFLFGFIILKFSSSFGSLVIFLGVFFFLIGILLKIKANKIYQEGLEEAAYQAERNRIAVEKAKAEREVKKKNAAKQIASVPKKEISVSSEKITNNAISDMGVIKLSRPRNGQKLMKYSHFVVIDIETTGLKTNSDKIIEVSAVRYEFFKPKEVFTTLLDPQKPIPQEASKINGITDSMVQGKPTFKSIIPALEEFIGASDLLGQNIMFDLKFLYHYGYDFTKNKRKYYDTLDIAKSKLKKFDERKYERNPDHEYDVDDYKLGTLCEYYGVEQIDAHRALGDCYATAQVFEAMLKNEYELISE